MSKAPFKEFYFYDDITYCTNKKCRDRFTCIRYMSKKEPYCFQFTLQKILDKYTCDNYLKYVVWRDIKGKEYTLEEITDQHLLAIIIHLYERNAIKVAKEFSKEARKRKLIK